MEAGFALEPLAGEAGGGEGSGGGVDAAEGGVGGSPDLHSAGVRREDGTVDVVGADEVDRPALDHRDRLPPVLDIFPDQGAGGLVVLGDPAAVGVEDRVDGDRARRGEGADRLPPHGVVFVLRLKEAVDREGLHPAGSVVGVGVGAAARPRLGDHIACGVVGEAAHHAGREADGGQTVGREGVEVAVGCGAKRLGQPVADAVTGIGVGAVRSACPGQAFPGGVGEGLGIRRGQKIGDAAEVVATLIGHRHIAEPRGTDGVLDPGQAIAETAQLPPKT